jgi:hypothetical protein
MTTSATRYAGAYSTAIQQRVTSGHFFDGTLPPGTVTETNHGTVYKYPAHTAGGLFYWDTKESVIVTRFHLDMGANANASLYLVNLDDNNAVVAGESILIHAVTATRYVALDESGFKLVLLPQQALQLITTNSAAAQIAQTVATIERTLQR